MIEIGPVVVLKGLISIYLGSFPPSGARSPASQEAVDSLREKDLVAPGKDGLELTDRGEAYLEHICATPLPKFVIKTTETWVVPPVK